MSREKQRGILWVWYLVIFGAEKPPRDGARGPDGKERRRSSTYVLTHCVHYLVALVCPSLSSRQVLVEGDLDVQFVFRRVSVSQKNFGGGPRRLEESPLKPLVGDVGPLGVLSLGPEGWK